MGSALLKLEGPTLPPQRCMFCACTPVDEHKRILKMVTCEGMDINWGETPYICMICCGIIADLIGRPSEEVVKAGVRGARLQKKHNEKLVARNEELEKVIRGLVDGQNMIEEAKELMSNGAE
jgi:hypothetical protein